MTDEERQLLETTARIVLKLTEDISDRVAGIEAVLLALFRAHGRTDIALARLRVQADFLKMKGTPSAYLSSFVDRAAGNRAADSELDVSFGSSNGRQQT